MVVFSLIVIVLGLVLLGFGKRMWLFGAGVGAVVGLALLRFLPGAQDGWLGFLVVFGLAILFAVGSGIAKGFIGLITLALGALAGGAIVLVVLDLFSLDWGLVNWLLALVGAVIGAGVMSKFKDWAIIILAALVGALLCTTRPAAAGPIPGWYYCQPDHGGLGGSQHPVSGWAAHQKKLNQIIKACRGGSQTRSKS